MKRTILLRLVSVFVVWNALAHAQSQEPSGKRNLRLGELSAPEVTVPRSYAVIIGVSTYPKLARKQQLQFAEDDAKLIYRILISPEGGNFKAENVRTLIGEQASLVEIRKAIGEWLPSKAKEGDRVLVYFAGHGDVFQGKAYLAPVDFELQDPVRTGYPMDELGATIGAKIHATSKILLTDACHSGAISPENAEDLNTRLLNFKQSIFSLTASRAREVSYEHPDLEGGHGVFTYFVYKGLGGEADADGNGVVNADELQDYVRKRVREFTDKKQTPTSEAGDYDPQMLMSWTGRVNVPHPATEVGSLIFEADRDGVEVFVDDNSVGVLQADHKTLKVPGLQPGPHRVKGVLKGFEPDGPRDEVVYPGQDSTVTFHLRFPRRIKKEAESLFDKGLKHYGKGGEDNYKAAVEYFEKALQMEPAYSEAANYLAQTYNALEDEPKAEKYFKKAIATDPDYLSARVSYAGMLMDISADDGAIRQLNMALERRPDYALAWTMLAQAQRHKALYTESIESARKAIQLEPRAGEPHLWLGDSLRATGQCAQAQEEYGEYLALSDFDSKLAGQLHYWAIGSLLGLGKRKRGGQHDIWKQLQSLAYFGLCNCEMNNSPRLEAAIRNCQRSISFDQLDANAQYALGKAFTNRAIRDGQLGDVYSAESHLRKAIELNDSSDSANLAREQLGYIREFLAAHR